MEESYVEGLAAHSGPESCVVVREASAYPHFGDLPSPLERIRQAARRDRKAWFTALLHHVYNLNTLREAYFSLKRDAAPGVDGQTWRAYGEALEMNLQDLSDRLEQERFCEAQEYYNRALMLAQEVGDRVNIGTSYMNLGRCACLTSNCDEAQARFDKALQALEGTDFWNGQALVYEHLAEMYLLTHRVDEALRCADQRIELARRHHNNHMEAEAWEQKAKAYEQIDKSDEALRCLKYSIKLSQQPPPYESLHRYLEEVSKRTPFR